MSTSNLNSHSHEAKNMQIDAIRFKPFTLQERKRRMKERLRLYCGEEGHKVGDCPKKMNQRATKIRGAIIQKNRDPNYNRNRAAGQVNITTTLRFFPFCLICPLFYNPLILRSSETSNYCFFRFMSICLLLRQGICQRFLKY